MESSSSSRADIKCGHNLGKHIISHNLGEGKVRGRAATTRVAVGRPRQHADRVLHTCPRVSRNAQNADYRAIALASGIPATPIHPFRARSGTKPRNRLNHVQSVYRSFASQRFSKRATVRSATHGSPVRANHEEGTAHE